MRLSAKVSFYFFFHTDVVPVFKKGSKISEHNYQPIRLKTQKTFLKHMKELCSNK